MDIVCLLEEHFIGKYAKHADAGYLFETFVSNEKDRS